MTAPRRDSLGLTLAERARLERLRELVASGGAQLTEVLAMRSDPSWAVRREVIAALGQLGEAALGPLCASLLEDRDDETRIAATIDALVASTGNVDARLGGVSEVATAPVLADIGQILGRRRDAASVPLLAALARNADDNVAVAAIEGLGKVGGRAVVDALVEAVQSQSFFRTFAAIDVLGKSGDPRAVAPLAALLSNPHYAFEAARGLGRTCDRAAAPPLVALLASPVDGLVRVAALSLAELRLRYGERFGATAPIEDVIRRHAKKAATRRLMHCLNGGDIDEQVAIHTVLGCLVDEAATPALLRALDGPPPVARAAVEALEHLSTSSDEPLVVALWEGDSTRRQMLLPRMRQSGASDAVIACLSDPDPVVRRLACEALARIGSRRAVPDLFDMLADPNPGVTQAATSALISLGHGDTEQLALRAASSDNDGVRRAALRVLAHLATPAALELFTRAVRDEHPRVREAAIVGLASFELPEAAELLLQLSSDDSAAARGLALRALGDGRFRSELVTERVTRSLSDPDPWVRYYACQTLGKLCLDQHVDALTERLHDTAGQVRVAAIEALSHLPSDTGYAALLAVAGSDDLDARRAALIGLGLSGRNEALGVLLDNARADDAATRLIALSALAGLDVPETLEALARATSDPDESVRMAAIGFLGSRASIGATLTLAGLVNDPGLGERARLALAAPSEHRVAGLSSALRVADDEHAVVLAGLLARLNQPDATAALFEAVTLPNVAARRAAATTLGALHTREALTTLQRLSVDDPDAEMRRVCALLLSQ